MLIPYRQYPGLLETCLNEWLGSDQLIVSQKQKSLFPQPYSNANSGRKPLSDLAKLKN